MLILAKDFTEEQKALAKELLDQLVDTCHELEESSTVSVYGLQDHGYDEEDERIKGSVLFQIEYSDIENDGNFTIFDCY